jgi:hypothetical protein
MHKLNQVWMAGVAIALLVNVARAQSPNARYGKWKLA